MKKVFVILLAISILWSFSACNKTEQNNQIVVQLPSENMNIGPLPSEPPIEVEVPTIPPHKDPPTQETTPKETETKEINPNKQYDENNPMTIVYDTFAIQHPVLSGSEQSIANKQIEYDTMFRTRKYTINKSSHVYTTSDGVVTKSVENHMGVSYGSMRGGNEDDPFLVEYFYSYNRGYQHLKHSDVDIWYEIDMSNVYFPTTFSKSDSSVLDLYNTLLSVQYVGRTGIYDAVEITYSLSSGGIATAVYLLDMNDNVKIVIGNENGTIYRLEFLPPDIVLNDTGRPNGGEEMISFDQASNNVSELYKKMIENGTVLS